MKYHIIINYFDIIEGIMIDKIECTIEQYLHPDLCPEK
ncbi:hypothetical protein RINTHM_5720 [Richelia intracellularis HM01]|nr:hypothetical protein RINTHM_5720 [Richelia intracellularis HM01]